MALHLLPLLLLCQVLNLSVVRGSAPAGIERSPWLSFHLIQGYTSCCSVVIFIVVLTRILTRMCFRDPILFFSKKGFAKMCILLYSKLFCKNTCDLICDENVLYLCKSRMWDCLGVLPELVRKLLIVYCYTVVRIRNAAMLTLISSLSNLTVVPYSSFNIFFILSYLSV